MTKEDNSCAEHNHGENCSCGHCHEEHGHGGEAEEVINIRTSSEQFIASHGGEGAGLKFPCRFPVKVFGLAESSFLNHVFSLVHPFVPNLMPGDCKITGTKGKYVSVTVNIKRAESREQLDSIYAALKADSRVKAML